MKNSIDDLVQLPRAESQPVERKIPARKTNPQEEEDLVCTPPRQSRPKHLSKIFLSANEGHLATSRKPKLNAKTKSTTTRHSRRGHIRSPRSPATRNLFGNETFGTFTRSSATSVEKMSSSSSPEWAVDSTTHGQHGGGSEVWNPIDLESSIPKKTQDQLQTYVSAGRMVLFTQPFQSSEWTETLIRLKAISDRIPCEATADLWVLFHLLGPHADHYKSLWILSRMKALYPENQTIDFLDALYAVYSTYVDPAMQMAMEHQQQRTRHTQRFLSYYNVSDSEDDDETSQDYRNDSELQRPLGSRAVVRAPRSRSRFNPERRTKSRKDTSSSPSRSPSLCRDHRERSPSRSAWSSECSLDFGSLDGRLSRLEAMASKFPLAGAIVAYCLRSQAPNELPGERALKLEAQASSHGIYIQKLPLPEPDRFYQILNRRHHEACERNREQEDQDQART